MYVSSLSDIKFIFIGFSKKKIDFLFILLKSNFILEIKKKNYFSYWIEMLHAQNFSSIQICYTHPFVYIVYAYKTNFEREA